MTPFAFTEPYEEAVARAEAVKAAFKARGYLPAIGAWPTVEIVVDMEVGPSFLTPAEPPQPPGRWVCRSDEPYGPAWAVLAVEHLEALGFDSWLVVEFLRTVLEDPHFAAEVLKALASPHPRGALRPLFVTLTQ